MGAWIEIVSIIFLYFLSCVAPFMGAWIEILLLISLVSGKHVAPFMGAWIEISQSGISSAG